MGKLTDDELKTLNELTEKLIGIRFNTLYFNYTMLSTKLENIKDTTLEKIDNLIKEIEEI